MAEKALRERCPAVPLLACVSGDGDWEQASWETQVVSGFRTALKQSCLTCPVDRVLDLDSGENLKVVPRLEQLST